MKMSDVPKKPSISITRYLKIVNQAINYYPEGLEPNKTSQLAHARFKIENQWFTCMDSAYDYGYQFNEGISLMVTLEDQGEIDDYWEKLSTIPEAEQCGWLKDPFGVSLANCP
ncbi:VOC family protein [Staphylococcus saprophyticus]|uniref:VOC family protein n=1 Tax=Staphylococcus saprophyticus TaxID=29385 RepID=UPI003F68DB86